MLHVERILVLKLDFIGDFITAVPALRQLRERFPAARLTLVCSTVAAELASSIGLCDTILTFDFFDKGWIGRDADRLAAFKRVVAGPSYDIAIDLRVDMDTRSLLSHCAARHRAGIGTGADFPFLDIALPSPRPSSNLPPPPEKPYGGASPALASLLRGLAILRFIVVLPAAPITLLARRLTPKKSVPVPPAADLWIGEYLLLLVDLCVHRLAALDVFVARELLGNEGVAVDRSSICIAPFANTDTRSWPAPYYRDLIQRILTATGRRVLVLGSPSQQAAIETMIDGLPEGRVTSLAGRTDLAQAVALLRTCDALVANNSGLAHLGGALGAKVLAIYSASHQVAEWGPRGPQVETISAFVDCRRCSLETLAACAHDHKCMTLITPDIVFGRLMRLLGESVAPALPVPPLIRFADGLSLGR